MKRLLSLLLTFCLTASLLPAQVQAAENASSGGLGRLGIRQISEKEYAMTPDVKEYEWILNNGALTQQMMGHVMEVKVGDQVLYGKYAGQEIQVDGVDYLIMKQNDILAII